ncbi:MAG TPA: M3 family metallopeptidase [Kineosporiaceae bacterium]|nr:M3 family metallopeptidase [Kineosporiaceae bacterium]
MTVDPLQLPASGSSWTDWLTGRVDACLGAHEQALAALKDGSGRATRDVLDLWNDSDLALQNAAAVTSLLAEVHPEEPVRTLAEDRAQDVSRAATDRGLDRGLYDVVAATDPAGLDEQAARLRDRVLRDFRRSGVDRDEATRERLRAIAERLTVLDQDFARGIRDDVRSIRVRPEQLAGLPQDYVDGHPPGDDGLVTITTDYPDAIPFRPFARDGGARHELTRQFMDRAWPGNDAVLAEMLALRHEQATLLGYDGWPDYDSEVKMIGSGAAIGEFVDRIAAAADEPARRDYAVLLRRLQQDVPGATVVDRADHPYYEELVRREAFGVDAQEVRRYFRFEQVRQGLLDVTGRLFGVEYRPVPGAASWHPDVAGFDVVADAQVLGRIHLDLHPREGKFKHAAQFDLVSGVEGRQLPEGVLVCNLPRGLMEHDDVVTLFHEFGHLVHHVLGGRQRWARFSGVATEWDFVEAPSQMLEEWAWDPVVLAGFAHDEDGRPIPADLVARMRAGNEFGKGYWVRMQMSYAAISYVLHRDRPADITPVVDELRQRYDLFAPIPGTHFHAAFGHLSGYGSAYYTYMWSLVIAKDLFSAFDRDDLFAPGAARRYRDEILARGGTRDAADLVATFLGRPYAFDAFAAWLRTSPAPSATSGAPAEV